VAWATVTGAGAGATAGAGGGLGGEGGGVGGDGSGAAEAPTGLTCREERCGVGVAVASLRSGAETLRRLTGRAAGPRPREKVWLGGESEATTRPTSLVSGGTTGGGSSARGPVAKRSDDAQTEAATVAKAGTTGPIRATIRFISAPTTRR